MSKSPASDTHATGRNGCITSEAINLRKAFGVVGALIAAGHLRVDLTNDWSNEVDCWVTTIAAALDAYQEI